MRLHLHPLVGPIWHPYAFIVTSLSVWSILIYLFYVVGNVTNGTQSMSFVEPTIPTNFPLNRSAGGPLTIQYAQETSHNLIKCDMLSTSTDIQPGPLL